MALQDCPMQVGFISADVESAKSQLMYFIKAETEGKAGARTLLGAPGLTRNKKLLGAPGLTTRSKDPTAAPRLMCPNHNSPGQNKRLKANEARLLLPSLYHSRVVHPTFRAILAAGMLALQLFSKPSLNSSAKELAANLLKVCLIAATPGALGLQGRLDVADWGSGELGHGATVVANAHFRGYAAQRPCSRIDPLSLAKCLPSCLQWHTVIGIFATCRQCCILAHAIQTHLPIRIPVSLQFNTCAGIFAGFLCSIQPASLRMPSI